MTLKTDKIVPALKAASKAGVDVDAALDQLTELVEATATVKKDKPETVLTTIARKHDGTPLVVAWDTCGQCLMHVRNCQCKLGPVEPSYIAKWVAEHEAQEKLRTAVDSPESAEEVFPAEAVPDSAETGIDPAGTATEGVRSDTRSRATCRKCGKPVETGPDKANADRDDDGAWTCFSCQEGGV